MKKNDQPIFHNVPHIGKRVIKVASRKNEVVKVIGLNPKTQERDVENCHRTKYTIQHTEISKSEVTLKEEIEFLKVNPDTD